MSPSNRWKGSLQVPCAVLELISLKTHLFDGRKAALSIGDGKLEVSAPGRKQQNSTKTGLVLEVDVINSTSPIILDLVKQNIRVFVSRVGYDRQKYVTSHSFILLSGNETLGDIRRLDFPVVLRPAFLSFFDSGWSVVKNIAQFLCQVTFGAIIPRGGLIFRLPVPAILAILVFATTSFAFVMDLPIWEVVSYVHPGFIWD